MVTDTDLQMSEVVEEVLVRSIWTRALLSRPENANRWTMYCNRQKWMVHVNSDMSVDISAITGGGYFSFGNNCGAFYAFTFGPYAVIR